jgi:hypothetical protein
LSQNIFPVIRNLTRLTAGGSEVQGFFRGEAAIATYPTPLKTRFARRLNSGPVIQRGTDARNSRKKAIGSDASPMRALPQIESVGLFTQNFSESVTSGRLNGSHLFASVIHASRKRA